MLKSLISIDALKLVLAAAVIGVSAVLIGHSASGQDLTGYEILRFSRIAQGGLEYENLKKVSFRANGFVDLGPIAGSGVSSRVRGADVPEIKWDIIKSQDQGNNRRLDVSSTQPPLILMGPISLIYTGSSGGGVNFGNEFRIKDDTDGRHWSLLGFAGLNIASGANLSVVRQKDMTERGSKYYVVDVKFTTHDIVRYYINQINLMIEHISTRYDSSIVFEELRSDFRRVGCLWLPFRIETKLRGQRLTDLDIDSYDIESNISGSQFSVTENRGVIPPVPPPFAQPVIRMPQPDNAGGNTSEISPRESRIYLDKPKTFDSFDSMTLVEQRKFLLDQGPLFTAAVQMNQIEMRVLIRGGWQILFVYSLKYDNVASIRLVQQNGRELLRSTLVQGEEQSTLLLIPSRIGSSLEVCKLIISTTTKSGDFNPSPAIDLWSLSVAESEGQGARINVSPRKAGRFESRELLSFENAKFDSAIVRQRESIADLTVDPVKISFRLKEAARFKFRATAFFSDGAAEFCRVKNELRGKEMVVLCETVASLPLGVVNANEFRDSQWNGSKSRGQYSLGFHQLKIRLWRGRKESGGWLIATAHEMVEVTE